MPYLTVNIAGRGTETEEGSSQTGHMWYSLDDGSGNSSSYGFSPDASHSGEPFAPGQVNAHGSDSENYAGPYAYQRTVEISQEQYAAMKTFGDKTAAGAADATVTVKDVDGHDQSFKLHYNGLSNSCIDYTWKALQVGGLNPTGYDGRIWPTWNKGPVDQALDQQYKRTPPAQFSKQGYLNPGQAGASVTAAGGGPLQVVNMTNQIICTGCPKPQPLIVTHQENVLCTEQLCAVITDATPMMNILPFGPCAFTPLPPSPSGGPCIPKTMPTWLPGSAFTTYDAQPALRQTDTLQCLQGGTISVLNPGQFIYEVE